MTGRFSIPTGLGRLASVAAIAVCATWVAPPAAADSSLEAVRARGFLRVGVKADAPPFGSRDAAGRPVGFEIDLVKVLARVLFDDDRRVEYLTVTTATRFDVLKSGQVDLVVATLTATDERRKLAELSDPYFMSASLLLVRRASPVERPADLGGQRVAVVKGSVQERDIAELQSRAERVPVESPPAGIQAVRDGRVEAFLYDDVVLLELAQREPALRVAGQPIAARPYAIAARKGDTGLIRWVNGWLAKLRRDGSYGEIWRRHFAPFESRLVGG